MNFNSINKQFNNTQSGNNNTQIFNFNDRLPQLEGDPFALPPTPELFGREKNLADLHGLLQEGKNVCVVAGMGGVGKSALVRKYGLSEDCKALFTGGVFYVDVGSRQNIVAEIVAVTKWHFKRDIPDDWSEQQQVRVCWQAWARQTQKALLILDDVSGLAETLATVLPPSELASLQLLMTSREVVEEDAIEELPLEVLSPGAAQDFLDAIIDRERVDAEPEAAAKLCEELGRLPLGLELVGHYLKGKKYRDLSLQAMREKLSEKVRHPSLSPEKIPIAMVARRGVQAAFALSWEEFKPEAQYLACVLGSFAAAPIAWGFVEAIYQGLQGDAFREDELRDNWLDALRRLHFVFEVEEDVYNLHPLIRDYLGEQLKLHSDQSQIKQAFWDCFTGVAHGVRISTTQKIFDLIAPHLQQRVDEDEGTDDLELANSLNGLAILYQSQGKYSEAEPLFLRSLDLREIQLGADHPHVAISLNNLAELYRAQGRYSEAEPLFLRSLSLRESQLEADHLDVASSLNYLAELYRAQGRYSEAEPLFLRSQSIVESQLEANHPYVASSLNNLAGLYVSQGRYSEAEPLFLRSQSIVESQLGADHPYVAISLNNLANLYHSQGRYSEAEPLFLRSLSLRESQLGADHPDVASSLNNLANLYQSQGRYSEAEPLYLRSLSLMESQLGADHPAFATSLNNLALFYETQGKYDETETLAKRALAIRQTVLGDEHPDTQNSVLSVKGLHVQNLLQCPRETLSAVLQALAQANNLTALDTETILMLLDLIASNPELTQSLREALQSQTEAT